MRRYARCVVIAAVLISVSGAGCTDDTPTNSHPCGPVDVEGYTSPAPGVVTATVVQIPLNASLLFSYTDAHGQTQTAVGVINPASQSESVTFQGLPSGTLTANVYISCAEGQFLIGPITLTIK
jgi:hypothetical protein